MDRSLILGGAALIVVAGLTTAWLSAIDILGGARADIAGALGLGVLPPLALLALAGVWMLAGASRLPGGRVARSLLIGGLVYVIALGISGFFSPGWTLGSVDLGTATASGEVGDWLASAPGVVIMLAAGLAISAMITPHHTAQALLLGGAVTWISSRWLGTQLRLLWVSRPRRQPTDLWESGVGPALAGPVDEEMTFPAAEPHLPPAPLTEPGMATVEPASEEVVAAATGPVTAAAEPKRSAARAEEPAPEGRHRKSADGWILPPLHLLKSDPEQKPNSNTKRQAQAIIDTLASFGVDARVTQVNEGPSVTQFGLEPGWDVKTRMMPIKGADGKPELDGHGQPKLRQEEVSRTRVRVNKITRLTNDIALALAAPSIRVQAPVPGQPIIGIEVPNQETRIVSLRGIIESDQFRRVVESGGLPIALGRGVTGQPVAVDLTKMPHLLIAGATGSGKSVSINGIIASLITHHSPESLRLVLVDPKRVELTEYKAIPHLAFSRVITDAEEVTGVLSVVVTEMERRYYRFQQAGARNIAAYNAVERPEGPLPFWVVILDELADLMMAAPVEVESQLVRLAQLARATGIHLVIATQRPSVDVVTGLIKANFPTRIAFATTSQTDSRVIMDRAGAEKLLGRGDMLFQSQDQLSEQRVQGAFVSDAEITALIEFWSQDRFRDIPRPTLDHMLDEALAESADPRAAGPVRVAHVEDESPEDAVPAKAEIATGRGSEASAEAGGIGSGGVASDDTMYPRAVELARQHTRVSASMMQRRLRVGYPRAERLLRELERNGVVGPNEDGPSHVVLEPETPVGAMGGGAGGGV